MESRFEHQAFTVRQKLFSWMGASFQVFNDDGEVVLFAKQKAFRFKEDIRLFASDAMEHEVLRIHARDIIDFSATYDIIDAESEELVGSLRRKGLKSMLKDEWLIFDNDETEIASIKEDNMLLAMTRRFLTRLIPQNYHIYNNDNEAIAQIKEDFNPFINKINVDLTYGADELLDVRLGLASAILVTAIEAKRK